MYVYVVHGTQLYKLLTNSWPMAIIGMPPSIKISCTLHLTHQHFLRSPVFMTLYSVATIQYADGQNQLSFIVYSQQPVVTVNLVEGNKYSILFYSIP